MLLRLCVSLLCCMSVTRAADKVDPGPAEPGTIKGAATTLAGEPIKSFGGSIYGTHATSGQRVSADIDGADGKYSTEVGPGQFATRAWTDIEFNSHKYRIDLEPVDGKGGLAKQPTKNGLIKNFVWKLDGFRTGVDERSIDRYYSHHGGSINLYSETNGAAYWTDIKKDYQHKPEPVIPVDATVEVTFTPDGKCIDGSEGQARTFKQKASDVKGYMDRITRGIAIAKYKVTAKVTLADGTSKPARVVPYYSFKGTDAPDPAETAVVEFIQSKPPSDNVNRCDEIKIHVMY